MPRLGPRSLPSQILALTAIGAMTLAAHPVLSVAQIRTGDDRDVAQPAGPVRIAIAAALVAPAKSDGRGWDGAGRLSEDMMQSMRLLLGMRDGGGLVTLFAAAAAGDPRPVIAEVAPAAVRLLDGVIAVPDVYVMVSRNGVQLGRTPVVRDIHPTWAGAWTAPMDLGPNDILEFRAVDQDIAFDDPIGTCTSRGMPMMTRAGYASGSTFTCNGQLLGLGILIRPEGADPFGSMPPLQ